MHPPPSSSSSSFSNRHPVVLNVAEKPSVARALASVFGQYNPGVQDRGMRREQGSHQVFTHENVQFPNVFQQSGHGRQVANHVPGTNVRSDDDPEEGTISLVRLFFLNETNDT